MRRQRRKRTNRRRGLQHIGDVLSTILTDVEKIESDEAQATQHESHQIPVAAAIVEGQGTFAFYQPVEV